MMRTFIFLFGIFFCGMVQGQVNLEWAKGMGSTGSEEGYSIAIDLAGNVYTTGYFLGTIDFDPGLGVFNLSSVGYTDIFISKLDASGNFIWAKRIGSVGDDRSNSIAVDANGNVCTTGFFEGTTDFDPGAGIFNLTPVSGQDIFISKLDANGNFIWAKRIGGSYLVPTEQGSSIDIDATGNIYTTGFFYGIADLNPNAGVFNLTSAGGYEIFILKLDASGNFVWAKQMRGQGDDWSYAITVDDNGNVYTTGEFSYLCDFDPGAGVFNLNPASSDIFVSKLDPLGNFVWAKKMGGTSVDIGSSIAVDASGNVYTTGKFEGTADFNPAAGGSFNLNSGGYEDIFISKLDALGNFVWAKTIGGIGSDMGNAIALDGNGNVYITGQFRYTIDFDPGIGVFNLIPTGWPTGWGDIYVCKLDAFGNFIWAKNMGGTGPDYGNSIVVDAGGHVYATGLFSGIADFDTGYGITNLNSVGYNDIFILKLNQENVRGHVFEDFNENCVVDINEGVGIERNLLINPGSIIVQSNITGMWNMDSLPAGTYTITADTTSPNWQITCPVTQSFTVVNPDSITVAPSFGFISTNPCTSPEISIHAPVLRPGFSNQNVYVQACNTNLGTAILDSAYVIVELDPLLSVQAGSQAYTALGNNLYRIDVGAIYPGFCVDFWLSCTLSSTAIIGQTLCLNATLYPVDSCALDDIPNPSTSCNTPYDFSDLVIRPECNNDTISFVITNTGDDDMTCFSQVRLYIDGVLTMIDSVQLLSGDTAVFVFAGDGRTWRLEVDQHPLFPGNSQPSATMELCGNASNWTPNLFNILPHNDADPQIDIYCGLVTGSFDPNDKTGYPLGIGTAHDILPNQDIEYVINFQNTGTDTAFTVVIRDTLSTDLDIFSVRSGVSSHDYDFRMYGPRVLEWTFYNIMLPDSNINEPASHGFISFKVNQIPDLSNGTVIQNSAAIYFDFNAPIFTNTSWHTINDGLILLHTEKERIEQYLQIKIYPNPTTGILHIDKMNHAAIQISVLDNLGRILLTQQSNDTITNLNINHLPTGIYYISINNGKEVMTEKIVKM